jgi:hypothetical protein
VQVYIVLSLSTQFSMIDFCSNIHIQRMPYIVLRVGCFQPVMLHHNKLRITSHLTGGDQNLRVNKRTFPVITRSEGLVFDKTNLLDASL